jgi:hypothetical protein
MGEAVRWVGDQLHELLGFSERATAEFLVGLATKASSEEALIQKFKATSAFETFNQPVLTFARDLFRRVTIQCVMVLGRFGI